MKTIHDLAIRQQKSSPTQNGQTNTSSASKSNSADNKDSKEAVAYLMMLLREAYPAQFDRVYPSEKARLRARGLWAEALKNITPLFIKKAAEKAVRSGNKFMPSLGDIINFCRPSYDELGLKEPLQAYYEACYMENPSVTSPWSHHAVYFAGKSTGWSLLRREPQERAFPLFKNSYDVLCQRAQRGDDLSAEVNKQLEDFARRDVMYHAEKKMHKAQQKLMRKQGIDPKAGRRAFENEMKKLET